MEISGAIHGQGTPRQEGREPLYCANCKGQWFISCRVARIHNFQVLMGQESPEVDPGVSFFLYECVSCGHLNEPPLAYTGIDTLRTLYDDLRRVVKDANVRRSSGCKCPGEGK